ncbi:integrase catalytic domain-containing protein, partial [Trichonephila clavata]
ADVAGKILTGKIEHLSCGLVAMQYILGWTVMGKVSNEINLDSSYLTLSLFVNEAKITDLWNLDYLGINDPCEKQSKEEAQELILKHIEETIIRESDGRYKVCIPWLEKYPAISDNKDLAQKRLKILLNPLSPVVILKTTNKFLTNGKEME